MNKDAVDANGIPDITRIAFVVGAILSLSTILWSVLRVPELPLTPEERAAMNADKLTLGGALRDVVAAIRDMPKPMRQLGVAMLCQWYAMFAYWQFIAFALARSLHGTADPASQGFRDAALTVGQVGAFYNAVAFVGALAMVPVTRRYGARVVHAACLAASGAAMLTIPSIAIEGWLYLPMIGIGIGWASMMGNPYVMLTDTVPPARFGIYMGIFNMFIVVPMMIESLTVPLFYRPLLGGDARGMLYVAGALMLAGTIATLRVDAGNRIPRDASPIGA